MCTNSLANQRPNAKYGTCIMPTIGHVRLNNAYSSENPWQKMIIQLSIKETFIIRRSKTSLDLRIVPRYQVDERLCILISYLIV